MKYTCELTKHDNATVDLTGTLAWADLNTYRAATLKELKKKVEIDGFRKGNVPEDILLKKIGDMSLLEEMSRDALIDLYPMLLEKHDVQAIGRPEIQITKLASGEDMGFKVTTAVMPEVKLADYKKIAKEVLKKKETPSVAKKDVDEALKQLRRMRFQSEFMKVEGAKHDEMPKLDEIKDKDLPELTDEYVKTLGEFKDIKDFTVKLEENLLKEKEAQINDKTRAEIIDALIEKSDISAPEMLVEYEIDKMMAQTEHDIAMAGMKMEDYLKHSKTTKEKMREEIRPQAQSRTYMQLVVNKIATEEKIEPKTEDIDKEIESAKETYKDHKDFSEDRARAYFESIYLNKAVIEFLEAQK